MNFYDKYLEARERNSSVLCVGLDTDINKLPDGLEKSIHGMIEFNGGIIEATSQLVCAYKINFAFYERYGAEGFEILKYTLEGIPEELPILADAKRGDIGNTSRAYAEAVFDYFGADAVTVNPYMGRDSVQPFLEFQDKFVFVLALTSNPGSEDFQRLESAGKPLYAHVVEKSMEWGDRSNLGYVIGASRPKEIEKLRGIAQDNIFLIPGIGAQGGDIESVTQANGNAPAIINVSRSIIYASSGSDFAEKAGEKAQFYRESLNLSQ